ncbi:response regulator [Niastella populi]|uniref:Response regulatory domain-containing protein n=1 Tax=Niastella populi TaxID=550983 RepID=A0A1V9GAD2_9BACT|nr:response regulator [Niastella populi]OQP67530.1 hypothetical protein A4R26_33270 [Niastella populi]
MEHKLVKIFITDDDQEDLELMEEAILKAEPSARLQKFTNGRTALEFLNSRVDDDLPCLIVLDYSMPVINGQKCYII